MPALACQREEQKIKDSLVISVSYHRTLFLRFKPWDSRFCPGRGDPSVIWLKVDELHSRPCKKRESFKLNLPQ